MLKVVLLLDFCLLCLCATEPIVGGYEDVNVDDEAVIMAADHATRELSKTFLGKYHHKLVKVLKAKKQVVAGMNYKMDIVVGKTTCQKHEIKFDYVAVCPLQDGDKIYKKCSVVVYIDLEDNHKLTTSECISTTKEDL